MKKLLLLSLLVLGAKSFAAVNVVGTAADGVKMPVVVRGEVVEATDTQLVIESDTVGMNGNKMLFEFDQVAKNGKAGVNGTFKVRKGANGALSEELGTGSGKLAIGLGDDFASTKQSKNVSAKGVTIDYTVKGSKDANVYNGIIEVAVTAGATTGMFEDSTQFIHAKIEG